MKAFYNLVTFLAAVVVLGWAGWCVYAHWDVLATKAATVAPVKAKKSNCDGCDCGCKENGQCNCASKGVDCPCKCGCGTSGKCDCGRLKADCNGCDCGCKENGQCNCASKGVDCPCKCGCGTSGKCDCSDKHKTK